MKHESLIMLLLICCLQANGQDPLYENLHKANACFEKGDYECAKQLYDRHADISKVDMSIKIKKSSCRFKIILLSKQASKASSELRRAERGTQ